MELRERIPSMRALLRYAAVAVLLAVLLELMNGFVHLGEEVFAFADGVAAFLHLLQFGVSKTRGLVVMLGLFLAGVCCHLAKRPAESIPALLFRLRVPLALLLWALLSALEISGSSVYMWHNYVPEGQVMEQPLYGAAQLIRSDEWAVGTPLAREAYYHGWSSSAYMQAVEQNAGWNPLLVFSPWNMGARLLGYNMGQACVWWFLLLGLGLVSVELLLLLTDGRKRLSAIGAVLVVLSPFVQWWNAAEYLLYGQLALVLLHRWLRIESFGRRILLLLGMVWCAGCYIFVLYPPWMVPFAWVFGVLALCLVWQARRSVRVRPRDVVAILLALALLVAALLFFLRYAGSAVQSTAGSVYPGQRRSTGGGRSSYLFSYFAGLFLPYYRANLGGSSCDNALFFSFYPVGLLLALWVIFRQRKRDPMLMALVALDVCLSLYAAVGFPAFLANVTLLSFSTSIRTVQMLGYLHLLVLLRGLALLDGGLARGWAAGFALAAAAVAVVLGNRSEPAYFTPVMLVMSFLVVAGGAYLFLRDGEAKSRWALPVFVVLLSLVCGAAVNPLQRGMAKVEAVPLYRAISGIDETAPGLWAIAGEFPVNNFPMMAGAETLNATQRYPDLARWAILDDSEAAKEVYNRYAHVSLALSPEPVAEPFTLVEEDHFRLTTTVEDLAALGVTYLITAQDPADLGAGAALLAEIGGAAPYRIYRVEPR